MSTKGKKVSAFAMFRNRKANSMTDVSELSPEKKFEGKKKKKSASASTTPVTTPQTTPTGKNDSRETSLTSISSKTSTGSMFSLNSKLSSAEKAEKKRQKAEMKRVKKLLKSAQKVGGRPSFLPDSAVNSPLAALGNGNVTLKSLRPKGSMTNINYNLPLKANPAIKMPSTNKPPLPKRESRVSSSGSQGTVNGSDPDCTPPLPPKQGGQRAKTHLTPPIPSRQGRASMRSNKGAEPPRQAPKRGKGSPTASMNGRPFGSDDPEVPPPRPAKRRKLSGNSISPSPQKGVRVVSSQSCKAVDMGTSSILSHDKDARERTEPIPAHPADRDSSTPYMHDSEEEARRLLECLLHPVKLDKFFNELFEKKPLLVKRHMPNYNDGWFSTAELDEVIKKNNIQYTENLDVVSYTSGKRETHNPVGRAYAPVVWDYYQNGCSIRMLNPQTYSRNVWKLLSILQEYFNCNVGANVYLTPPGTQGFAPHYDDIEAFILQLEGKKHWRLYSPRSEGETLPRFSSNNFTDTDIGDPILDVILEAGDLLYFPRGLIHQGRTLEDAHSLHITVSTCQHNTWGDLLQKLVPAALDIAMQEDIEFRKALPLDYPNYMGMAFSDSDSPQRTSFLRHVEQLMKKLLSHSPVDAAADQMSKKYIHDSLPPVLTEAEKQCSVHGNGEHWDEHEMRVRGAVEIEPDTEVKLIRKGIMRLLTEGDKVCIYHNLENTRLYHEVEPQYIEVSEELAPGVEHLLQAYPDYVTVDSFPLEQVDDKMELVTALYEKGLIMTRVPLEHLSESSSEDEGPDN